MVEPRTLITGVTGQDGAYMAKRLVDAGHKVFGGVWSETPDTWRLERLSVTRHIDFLPLDLSDDDTLSKSIAASRPDYVFNLGGLSSLGKTERFPELTQQINCDGPYALFKYAIESNALTRIFQASSAYVFGEAEEVPQTETTPRHPATHYARAKSRLDAHLADLRDAGRFAVSGILYNHESPLRGDEFVTQKIVQALARIKAGSQETLELGNLDSLRDWSYAADFIDGMCRTLAAKKPDTYVFASGTPHAVRDWLTIAAQVLDLNLELRGQRVDETGYSHTLDRTIVRINPSYYREETGEPPTGDSSKARHLLNWQPQLSFDALVKRMTIAAQSRVGV